jgi:von Willebrand factor type A domain
MSLANDDNTDEVRFQLPMGVGQRYGTPPPELESAHGHSSHTRIRLTAQIQTSGKIQHITSPSHQADISEVAYLTHHGRPSRRRSTIKFKSRTFLDRDFVLIIEAEGLDTPRCFAELDDPNGRGSATIAMQLTLIPKFDLPPIKAQEYLFVIDRSGSMNGERISTAKRTLATLIRMLPSQGTMFNIFSFGSLVDGLWPRSWRYNQSSLDTAVSERMVYIEYELIYGPDCAC